MTPEAERKLHAKVQKLESQIAEQQALTKKLSNSLTNLYKLFNKLVPVVKKAIAVSSSGLGFMEPMKDFLDFGGKNDLREDG